MYCGMGPGPMGSIGPMGTMQIPGAMPGPMGMGFGPGLAPPMQMPMPMPIGSGVGAGSGGSGARIGVGVMSKAAAVVAATAETRKKTAVGQEMRHEMRERMRYIMYEIDESNEHFISGHTEPFQFLDVCCCPGGFSTYSLTAGSAPRKGIGFSLPPELGGHLPAIQQETDNYLMHFVDVTTVAARVRIGDMAVGVPGCPRHALKLDAAPDAPPVGSCQLVILDGSFLGGKDWIHKETTVPDSENPAFNVYGSETAAHKALLIAQLIIMANNLAPGGVLVLRLNMFADLFTAGVLGLLRHVFHGDVCSYKPRSCHVHRGSYYLVCKGFDPQRAYCMQWVSRWSVCLTSLRNGGVAPRFVPFPGLHLDNKSELEFFWTRALYVYHVHLWRFSKLVEVSMEEKAILDQRLPNRPRQGRFTHSCGRIFAGQRCGRGACNAAHSFEELHPFVQKAFREPRGFLYMPSSLALMQAPLVNTDPLPETLLELRQQAHMQAVLQAQAAATRQQDALKAAAHAASGNVLGHIGSYDNAVELGMGGEWVHGMVRSHDLYDNNAPAAQIPAPPAPDGVAAAGLKLLMRENDVVMEGGFEDDDSPAVQPPPPLQPTQQSKQRQQWRPPGAPPSALSPTSAAAVATATRDVDREFASLAAGVGGGDASFPPSGSGSSIQPELLRMSGYQPRLGLVAIEIEDEYSLSALLDYLGR